MRADTITSKLFKRILSPGVNTGLTLYPVLVPYRRPLLWNFQIAPLLYSVPLA